MTRGGDPRANVPLRTIAREWTRIGCLGFGGPPTHLSMLRQLCVTDRRWLDDADFEDGVAATALLPGPASTQMAILCAWKLRGTAGALLGGLCFIVPGLVLIIGLAAAFLAGDPPRWLVGAANGSGAAVPMVALAAAIALVGPSRARAASTWRWGGYVLVAAAGAVVAGPWLVLLLLACGGAELLVTSLRGRRAAVGDKDSRGLWLPLLLAPGSGAGLAAAVWVGLKVGALSYGGGFVIIPLMQNDAVHRYHWMTGAQFLNAVALGQITPGPVVHTVAVVGFAAGGVPGALLTAAVAFAPSFAFVLLGGPHLDRVRRSVGVQRFLGGAGPAAIGAIGGSAVPLAAALQQGWQFLLLATAGVWLLVLRRGVVPALLTTAAIGAVAAASGAPVAH